MRKKAVYIGLGAELAVFAWLVTSPALLEENAAGVTAYGLSAAIAVLLGTVALHLAQKTDGGHVLPEAPKTAAVLLPCGLLGARLLYGLARLFAYYLDAGVLHMLMLREGGFILYGAVMGAALGVFLLAGKKNFARAMDEVTVPGLLVTAFCRLAEGLAGEGLGAWVEDEALMRLPFASMNTYGEYQWAIYIPEALAALAVLLIALRQKKGEGQRALTALLLYACCQVVLESLRADSVLKLGFVRVSQVLSAVVILTVFLIRLRRYPAKRIAGAVLILAVCVGAVGGLEWALDKTQISHVILYAVMAAVCCVLAYTGRRRAE